MSNIENLRSLHASIANDKTGNSRIRFEETIASLLKGIAACIADKSLTNTETDFLENTYNAVTRNGELSGYFYHHAQDVTMPLLLTAVGTYLASS